VFDPPQNTGHAQEIFLEKEERERFEQTNKLTRFCVEILGSHGGEYEDDCVLECCAV
jgi:hypothetical protein